MLSRNDRTSTWVTLRGQAPNVKCLFTPCFSPFPWRLVLVLVLENRRRMDVETDAFAFLAVAVAFEGADLVEGDAQVGAAEGFVLVEFESVLVVEMERPEFIEGHREINFIGRVEAGEDGMGGLDEAADAF